MEFVIGSFALIALLGLGALAFRPQQFKPYPPIVRLGARVDYDQEVLIDAMAVRARVRGPEHIKFDNAPDYLRKYAGFKNYVFREARYDHQDWGDGMTSIWVVVIRSLTPATRFWNVVRGFSAS